jgi:mono/diheme cytochrome c family protein
MRHGEYLALNACSECHGLDFSGQEEFAPPLDIAKAYDRAAFGRLMSEGVGVGDRDLGLMSAVARNRFSVMTDDEIDHLHGFLQSR